MAKGTELRLDLANTNRKVPGGEAIVEGGTIQTNSGLFVKKRVWLGIHGPS